MSYFRSHALNICSLVNTVFFIVFLYFIYVCLFFRAKHQYLGNCFPDEEGSLTVTESIMEDSQTFQEFMHEHGYLKNFSPFFFFALL